MLLLSVAPLSANRGAFWVCLQEQKDQDVQIVCSAFNKVMQEIQRERSLLCSIREKYLQNLQVPAPAILNTPAIVLSCQLNILPSMPTLRNILSY